MYGECDLRENLDKNGLYPTLPPTSYRVNFRWGDYTLRNGATHSGGAANAPPRPLVHVSSEWLPRGNSCFPRTPLMVNIRDDYLINTFKPWLRLNLVSKI
jgi:hypothetical protein